MIGINWEDLGEYPNAGSSKAFSELSGVQKTVRVVYVSSWLDDADQRSDVFPTPLVRDTVSIITRTSEFSIVHDVG